jgi:hypothetical protein
MAEIQDFETGAALHKLEQGLTLDAQKFSDVKSVLFVFSSFAVAFDPYALRHMAETAYPGCKVYFMSISGQAWGTKTIPNEIDLVVDFSPPKAHQNFLFARKMRKLGKHVVGRNVGLFRKSSYDRIFDEKENLAALPVDMMARERVVQRKVLELAGIAAVPNAKASQNLEKEIATELPPLKN